MAYKDPKKRFCFVYKTTNLINQKYYIGCHCTYKLDDGYLGSGMRIQRSIAKYGRENFKLEILEFFETRELALAREKELVTEELLKDPMCMNLKTGGTGFDSITGRQGRLTTNRILHWRLQNDPEYRKRYSESMRRAKIGKDSGKWSGRRHKESTKRLMRLKASNRTPNENSQFGTCWITKEQKNKKIKVEDLQTWLNEGWIRGRSRWITMAP